MGKGRKNKAKVAAAASGGGDVEMGDAAPPPAPPTADGGDVSMGGTVALTGKAKKRAEMQAKRLHKVQVASLKKGTGKLDKKDYVQRAERRALERHIREVEADTKEKVKQKSEERFQARVNLPGCKGAAPAAQKVPKV